MKIRVRMYRQGLGDCFLVSFFTGPTPVHMLVDCGTLGATTTGVSMKDVVKNIADETGRHLHVLVATHEHKDHVSGFSTGRQIFDQFDVDRVWVAWTEDPADDVAVDLEKYEDDLLASIQLAAHALSRNQARDDGERRELETLGSGVRELLGFYGDLPAGDAPFASDFAETVHEAMSYVTTRAGGSPPFLLPGALIEPSWLPGVRFYVLGPPRKEQAIKVLGGHESPELYHAARQTSVDLATSARFGASGLPFMEYRNRLEPGERQTFERGLPFDPRFRLEETDSDARARCLAAYDDPAAAWRRIDYDWLTAAGDLALQLDSYTNNTSLVLAIELVDDGRVLLFPADAQLGNWLSWHSLKWNVTEADGSVREVKAADLLKRTVFYKVGHHASHNATVREQGLELMQRDDLVAMIPVDRKVALKKDPPWQMPAAALYERLLEKTRGRVLRSDTGWPEDEERPALVSQAEWDEARASPNITVENLFIDFRLE